MIKYLRHEIASLHSVWESRKESSVDAQSAGGPRADRSALSRLEEALEQKADRDVLEDCSSELEELREDVGDLEGQLADAESRIDDLEDADWT